MMDKLEQLRKKPDHIKHMIAAGTAGGITLVIVLFWVVSASITGGTPADDQVPSQVAATPFTTLSASVANAFAPVTDMLNHLKDMFNGVPASSSNAIQIYSPNQSAQTNGNQEVYMNTLNQ